MRQIAEALLFSLMLLVATGGTPAMGQVTPETDAEPAHQTVLDPAELVDAEAVPLSVLTTRAESGESDAQFELGTRYLYGVGVTQDNFAAAQWFRLAAAQGNTNAQYNLGVMSLNGLGMLEDFDEALRWFRQAAENGDTTAQFTLGVIHANGQGVAQDFQQAHMWFTLAAAGGDESAAINAVLFQEMLSDEQLQESVRQAQAWVERFNRTAAEGVTQ